VIEKYIYHLLEKEGGLKKLYIPVSIKKVCFSFILITEP